MRYRKLGESDLEVSVLSLGSWLTYGVTVDRAATRACIRRAFEIGINLFDTANMYGQGAAEELLGDLLSAYRREDYLLATKVYFPMSPKDRGLSRRQIHKQLDASLRRLRTDYVDLYQCHRFDRDTPLEETMQALTEVVAAGKVRQVGFSQWTRKDIRAAGRLDGVVRFVSSQPQYSLLERRAERKVFGACARRGIGQLVWSPLAQGVLTGKYLPGQQPPAGSRAAHPGSRRKMRRFLERPGVLEAVQRVKAVADRASLSLAQLSLAWVLQNDNVSSAILGANQSAQLDHNAKAVGVRLDAEILREIDAELGDVVRR